MITPKFLISFGLMASNQNVFNNIQKTILSKIHKREYVVFDSSASYTVMDIWMYDFDNTISCTFTDGFSARRKNDEVENFKICYENKSICDITEEIEAYVKKILHFPDNNPIILIYHNCYCENYSIMKNVINNIKKINSGRRKKKKGSEIYYEIIAESDSHFNTMYKHLKKTNTNARHDSDLPNSAVDYFKCNNNDTYYFRIRIIVSKLCYLFELNINELDVKELNSLVKIKKENYKKNDKEILINLISLFKIHDLENISESLKFEHCTFKTNKIEIKYYNYFKVELKNNALIFQENSNVHYKYLKNKENQGHEKTYIEEKNFRDFKNFLDKVYEIKNIDNGKGVEFFYRLINRHNKVEFLVLRILNKPGSALNLLLGYLLLFETFIQMYEFDIITGQVRDGQTQIENRQVVITKYISGKISKTTYAKSYLMKICLLLEAENFINEDDLSQDLFFKSLKNISVLMNSNYDENNIFIVTKILQEVQNKYIDEITRYKTEILENLCDIISNLTSLKSTEFINRQFGDGIITNIKTNEFETRENVNLFMKILLKNSKQDKKYAEVRKINEKIMKYIKEIADKIILCNESKLISSKALEKNNINLLVDEIRQNLIKDLVNEGMKMFDKKIQSYVIEDELIKDTVNKIKNEFKKGFTQEIRKNVVENITNNLGRYLVNLFFILLEPKAKNELSIKSTQCKQMFVNIRPMLSKNVLMILNMEIGGRIHNILVEKLEICINQK
ncbi:uncharacterized protein VNE69_02229 [Vairimorpha necatrix]|uniref:Uncharacterized protein n=1 Tax=Vairimorpha necatrix TaxID=6039 RepID=A0AAX4J9T2_9MICR